MIHLKIAADVLLALRPEPKRWPASPTPSSRLSRVPTTKPDRDARTAAVAGCSTRRRPLAAEDPVGNIFARWPGSDPGLPAVGTGSHIDAIPFSGMYRRALLKVLGGPEAIWAPAPGPASGRGVRPSLSLLTRLRSRSPASALGCAGSRLLAGTLDPAKAAGLRDKNGTTLDEIRREADCSGGELSDGGGC